VKYEKKKKASKGHARASEIIASLARFVSLVNPARTHLGLIPSRRLFGQRNAKKEKERERERERNRKCESHPYIFCPRRIRARIFAKRPLSVSAAVIEKLTSTPRTKATAPRPPPPPPPPPPPSPRYSAIHASVDCRTREYRLRGPGSPRGTSSYRRPYRDV